MTYDVDEVAELIGVPKEKWAGNCHAVCAKMLVHPKLLGGDSTARLVRGQYLGDVSGDSVFRDCYEGGYSPNHSWLVANGSVVDPTRFAFEAGKPYIFLGGWTGSYNTYDPCGSRMKDNFYRDAPPYSRGEGDKSFSNAYAFAARELLGMVDKVTPHIELGRNQLFWLANLPVTGGIARRSLLYLVYEALTKLGMNAFIPMDNYHYVMYGGYRAEDCRDADENV